MTSNGKNDSDVSLSYTVYCCMVYAMDAKVGHRLQKVDHIEWLSLRNCYALRTEIAYSIKAVETAYCKHVIKHKQSF